MRDVSNRVGTLRRIRPLRWRRGGCFASGVGPDVGEQILRRDLLLLVPLRVDTEQRLLRFLFVGGGHADEVAIAHDGHAWNLGRRARVGGNQLGAETRWAQDASVKYPRRFVVGGIFVFSGDNLPRVHLRKTRS